MTTAHIETTHQETMRLLRRATIFQGLDEKALAALAARARRRVLARGAVLQGGGQAHDPIYVLGRGRVALYRRSPDAQELITDTLHAGDVVGFIPYDAQVLVAGTVVCGLPQPYVHQLMAAHPPVGLCVTEMLCRWVVTAHSHMEALAWHSVGRRLAHTLARLAQLHPRHEVDATHAELAAMVGTRQDEVTRLLRRFRELGLVAKQPYRPGLAVLDVERLAAF